MGLRCGACIYNYILPFHWGVLISTECGLGQKLYKICILGYIILLNSAIELFHLFVTHNQLRSFVIRIIISVVDFDRSAQCCRILHSLMLDKYLIVLFQPIDGAPQGGKQFYPPRGRRWLPSRGISCSLFTQIFNKEKNSQKMCPQ